MVQFQQQSNLSITKHERGLGLNTPHARTPVFWAYLDLAFIFQWSDVSLCETNGTEI